MNVPKFNPQVVARLAKRLLHGADNGVTGLLADWAGKNLNSDPIAQVKLAQEILYRLPYSVSMSALLSSLAPLFAAPITAKELEFVLWRIAARVDDLLLGQSIPVWSGLPGPTLAPVQVVHVKTGWSSGAEPKLGYILTLRVIAGDVCPLKLERFVTKKFTYVMARDLGLRGTRKKPGYVGEPNQLYGMRFVAHLVKSPYDDRVIDFDRFVVGQFANWNKRLLQRRAQPCPIGCAFPCHKCSMGENECPASQPVSRACRPLTILRKECAVCSEPTFHDGSHCMPCRKRRPIRVSKQE